MNYYEEKIWTDFKIPAVIYMGTSRGAHYPMHWHNNLEFVLVLQGSMKGKINRKEIMVNENELFFVNSGELHETKSLKSITSITILISYELFKEYCNDIDNYYFDLTHKREAENEIKSLLYKCSLLYKTKQEFYELEISIILRKICAILLKECRKKRENLHYSSYDEKNLVNVKKAISYMEKNYENDISLNDISEEIGMVPTYFSRFFKSNTGDTFYNYLNKIRLYYAHRDLLNSDLSITEIALNNGFSNVKSFIELFKKAYGITPAKYRKDNI